MEQEDLLTDYEPIDISSFCNVGAKILGDETGVKPGLQSFRGLPFLLGTTGQQTSSNCFVQVAGAGSKIKIPVGRTARRVIFAHRQMESDVINGGPLGAHVADYIFHLDGTDIQVPIRERFEIASVTDPWGVPGVPGAPFLAVSDEEAKLYPRYEGPWEGAGRRQTEAAGRRLATYYLWAWENPQPETPLDSIEIVATGPAFLIAGVTLGHLDEHPFARQGRRPVKVLLTDPSAASKPFDLEAEVDRGNTTYIFPLPESTGDEFVNDSYYSWGQTQNERSSPAYVEVSAIPSATLTVKQGDAEIGKVNWGEVQEKGSAESAGMKVELLDPGKNWVHVTVLDEETGKPVPCRIHFRSPDGVPYQPHGHHNQVNSNLGTWHNDVGGDIRLGQITYACIDGSCQGWLPRGDVIVDASRGFEYEPLRTKVRIEPGQRELTLSIKRWTNMNAQGWYSGDSHVHFLSPQGAHRESQSEDLNVVNLLQSQWGSLFTNTEDFTGGVSVSPGGDSLVYVSQENRQHFMGHMILWGLKKPVMPWCSDGLNEAEIGGTMDITLADWADQCHAQGGWVINPHFPNPNGEPAALIATGRLDGIEMIRQTPFNHFEYYRYLNCGYRLPLVGGTDKMSNDVPVGLYRTYAKLPEDSEFTYDNWCKSVASGRTFLSGGPIIHFSINGHELGDTVTMSGPGNIEVEAWAESIFPIHRLEIVEKGRVVASAESKEGSRRLEIKDKINIDSHTWLAARCGGPEYYGPYHIDAMTRGIFAHTSPIYVACGGEWWMFDKATAQYMLTLIDGDLSYIRESSAQPARDNVTHHHGEDDHMAYLERPFLEAQAAIHERMRGLGLSL